MLTGNALSREGDRTCVEGVGGLQMGKRCVECWAAKGLGHSGYLSFLRIPLCIVFVECRSHKGSEGKGRKGREGGRCRMRVCQWCFQLCSHLALGTDKSVTEASW